VNENNNLDSQPCFDELSASEIKTYFGKNQWLADFIRLQPKNVQRRAIEGIKQDLIRAKAENEDWEDVWIQLENARGKKSGRVDEMKKPIAKIQQQKNEIEQLSQAELVELVLELQKNIQELQQKLAIATSKSRTTVKHRCNRHR
jgi:phosphoglycolate phosphatase-like HAD superfamily hydrolase